MNTNEKLCSLAISTPVAYKPGWTLHFAVEPEDGLVAHLSAYVPDSRRDRFVTFTDYWPVPQHISEQRALYDWLLGKFDEIEQHETREFYAIDGVLWDDPHAPDKPAVVRQGF